MTPVVLAQESARCWCSTGNWMRRPLDNSSGAFAEFAHDGIGALAFNLKLDFIRGEVYGGHSLDPPVVVVARPLGRHGQRGLTANRAGNT